MEHPIHTILIIDDDPFIRTQLATNLEENGYAVMKAEDGRQGLEIMRNHPLDLVMLDLLMPEMSGFEVLQQIRTDRDLKENRHLSFERQKEILLKEFESFRGDHQRLDDVTVVGFGF